MKKRVTKYPCRRTVRITKAEDEKLKTQAAIARISVAGYMRRKFFGGRPIIARTDDLAIRELRRLGGLLKHNFVLAAEANQPKAWHEMRETLDSVVISLLIFLAFCYPSPKGGGYARCTSSSRYFG